MKLLRVICNLAIALAMLVIVLGAYTRLTDAGLGCPDWPGCYGQLAIPQAHHADEAAVLYPERPLEPHKARNEMVHRYLAGSLGMLIGVIFVLSWRHHPKKLGYPALLVAIVVAQAALGMWTVTMKLHPLVVMGHLLGGMTLLSVLWLYRMSLSPIDAVASTSPSGRLRKVGGIAALLVLGQIALGGWTSANYAAMACVDLPVCHSGWVSQLDFKEAFHLPDGHDNYEYGVKSKEGRQTIHISHRFGAMLVLLVVGYWVRLLWQSEQRMWALTIGSLLAVQLGLGLMNVYASLPLANAVAHNIVGMHLFIAVLLAWRQQPRPQRHPALMAEQRGWV